MKKTDSNQKEIVSTFRKLGASVLDCSALGRNAPDILVGTKGKNVLVEIKTPTGSISRGQLEFIRDWRGLVALVHSNLQAQTLVENPDWYCFKQKDKDFLAQFLIRWRGKSITVNKLQKEFEKVEFQ